MSIHYIDIEEFIKTAPHCVVFDVRSPKEYEQAHYPKAFSLPLFSNEERAEIGTIYKRQNREKAIKKGFDYFGPKMKLLVEQVEQRLRKQTTKTIIVHCWRGGMRSAAVAWLLDFYGFETKVLHGGYKAYRNWVLQQFTRAYPLRVLGGFTGSGKTEILQDLAAQGKPVVDLEGLAQHKGSAFGNLDDHHQNTTEQFENDLAMALYRVFPLTTHTSKIWIESESSRIGNVRIPHLFFNQMKAAERIDIRVPFQKRLHFIIKAYGDFDQTALIKATHRIEKRLGGLNMKNTIAYLEKGDLEKAFSILLNYYDKVYEKSAEKFTPPYLTLDLPDTDPEENTKLILAHLQTI